MLVFFESGREDLEEEEEEEEKGGALLWDTGLRLAEHGHRNGGVDIHPGGGWWCWSISIDLVYICGQIPELILQRSCFQVACRW